jgi:hypothetical protein
MVPPVLSDGAATPIGIYLEAEASFNYFEKALSIT